MWRICTRCGVRGNDVNCADCGRETQTISNETRFPGRLDADTVLDRHYRVGDIVGVGGMGAVYRGEHVITRQPVAIKVLWRDLAEQPAEVRRFTREARAASLLAHPNTVRVFDFGDDAPSRAIYMVMELLVGRKLSDLLAETLKLEASRVVHIATQVCKALEEAHRKGLVHRDLKPDNIFLQEVAGERDFVKVLDFGLAKFVSGDFERDALTRTGYVVGSPEYMAPEQAIGSTVTASADLYSLGIVMYECLAGDLPFDAMTTAQVLRKHILDSVPAMDVELGVPARLERVVLRCLEKDPEARPASAEALRIELLRAFDRRRRDSDIALPQVVAPGSLEADAAGAGDESGETQGAEVHTEREAVVPLPSDNDTNGMPRPRVEAEPAPLAGLHRRSTETGKSMVATAPPGADPDLAGELAELQRRPGGSMRWWLLGAAVFLAAGIVALASWVDL